MVRIITDSTSSIPQNIRAELGIEAASLIINRNGEELVELETDLDAFYKDIYEMADNIPTSSQPPLGKLREVVESIAKTGDEVLGIFISSKLSGTFESFVHTAKEVKNDLPNFRFAAIDSMTTCMEMGWPAIAAAKAAKTGASLDGCIQAANTSLHSTRFVFAPESLLFLQKGGRIGKAAALIGNMISLTPVLTVNDGEASTFSKCRTQKKALAKMLQVLGEDTAPSGLKNLVVHYIGSKVPAMQWAEEKVAPLIGFMPRVVPASPVIGVHVGPAMGIAYECNAPIPNKFHNSEPEIIVC